MMLKEKSSPWARLKYLYVLPLAAIAVTAFARPEVSKQAEEISAVKVNDLAAIVETKVAESINTALEEPKINILQGDTTEPAEVKYIPTEVNEQLSGTAFDIVEQMPEFPGGIPAFMKYLQDNMRYPEAAKKAGVQGRVIVQFVVDKDGSLKNPSVIRSVDKELDTEAIRLIINSPKWEPGRQKGEKVAVKYTIPVVFKWGDNSAVMLSVHGAETPLYVVDGTEVSPTVMGALDPNKIGSMEVLKNDVAAQIYGEKGKNGVILITLKNTDPTVIGVSGNQKKSIGYSVKTTTTSNSLNLPGVGGVYANGNKTDLEDVTIYIDNVKTDLKGKQIEDVIPADQIESISVSKSTSVDNGKATKGGEIYITTKKNAKGLEKTSAKGNMKVEGSVKDVQGNPIIGASIIIEGTTTGTITDNDGKFALSVPSKDAVLLIAYINMESAKVKAQPKMTIVLKDE